MYKSVFFLVLESTTEVLENRSMKFLCLGGRLKQIWSTLEAFQVGVSPPGEMLHLLLSLIRWQHSRDAFNVESLLSVAGSMTAVNLLSVSLEHESQVLSKKGPGDMTVFRGKMAKSLVQLLPRFLLRPKTTRCYHM